VASRVAATLLAITAAITAAVFIGCVDELPADRPEPESWADLSTAFDTADLQDVDLVFRRGRDAIADAVMTYGKGSRYSHVGAIVLRDGRPFVIHAIPGEGSDPGGVVEEPFPVFGSPAAAADLGVYRLTDLTDEQRAGMVRYLEAQRGKPFDLELRASDDEAQYCTELVFRALEAGEVPSVGQIETIESGLMSEPVIAPEALLALPGVAPVPTGVASSREPARGITP
jgi:hypothetical protein